MSGLTTCTRCGMATFTADRTCSRCRTGDAKAAKLKEKGEKRDAPAQEPPHDLLGWTEGDR